MPSAKFRRFTRYPYLAGCLVLGMVGSLRAGDGQQSETIRILSYNIKHGQGMDDRVDLKRAAAVINSLQPDLVALQEIDNVVRTIPDKGADRLTFSPTDPRREIDFIMYRPEGPFEVVDIQVIDEPLVSVHRPVLLVLSLRQ
jgi:endonuclease/exonuclease/phosphatase family metal-dependent hydrolase